MIGVEAADNVLFGGLEMSLENPDFVNGELTVGIHSVVNLMIVRRSSQRRTPSIESIDRLSPEGLEGFVQRICSIINYRTMLFSFIPSL